MPDPWLYLSAMGAATIASALTTMVALAMVKWRRPASVAWLDSTCVLAIGLGLAAGFRGLSWQRAWPPANALDRFLTIVLPLALGIELIAGLRRVPRPAAWLMRLALAASLPRILLHGSVYLSGGGSGWTPWQAGATLAACGGMTAGLWCLLSWLAWRSPGLSLHIGLCLTLQCAGLTIMMAGYIKGGAASFPLVATLLTSAITLSLIAKVAGAPADYVAPACLGISWVSLCGLLLIGSFFGRLPTNSALVILLAPLMCWVTEAPALRRRPAAVGAIRLTLVAIPLLVVLIAAKRHFDREMGPLLLGRFPDESRHALLTISPLPRFKNSSLQQIQQLHCPAGE